MQQLELDKLDYFTDVTKKEPKMVDAAARDGCFISGMYLEGGRWDVSDSLILTLNLAVVTTLYWIWLGVLLNFKRTQAVGCKYKFWI